MSDKWQQINLRLDAELAQALRELKRGHDESLAEVVIRVLKKVVRQSPVGARGAPGGRSNVPAGAAWGPRSKDRAGRGVVGRGRKGKPMAAGRTGSTAGAGKPWAASARDAEEGSRKPAWLSPPRGPRRSAGKVTSAGKPARPELGGASEPRRRNFRASSGGLRSLPPSDELGATEERPRRPRAAKGRRSSGR